MDKIRLHIPTVQYGYIEVEIDFALENKEKLYQEAIEDFKRISKLWNSPIDIGEPKYLGETKIENGHTYKAVCNEGDSKLYWLIDKI